MQKLETNGNNPMWDEVWITWFGVLLCALLYMPIFYHINGYGFWRHDDIPYLGSFDDKLHSEGRWLNYIFFSWLRAIPGHLAWYIDFSCGFWFCYSAAKRFFGSNGYALIVAAACLVTPGFYAQLEWPVTTLLAALLLALAVPLSRKVPYIPFMSIMGILLFAVAPNFYYFLPLLYIDRTFPNARAAIVWWIKLLSIWVGGFVQGYVIANLITRWKFGTWIELAWWREPHPVTNLASLAENTLRNVGFFVQHFSELFPYAGIVVLCIMVMLGWQILYQRASKDWIAPLTVVVVGIIIGIIHYVITIPAGIAVVQRSVVSLYIGLVFGLFALSLPLNRIAITLIVLLGVVIPAWINNFRDTLWYSTTTTYIREEVKRSLPAPATAFSGVIVDVRQFDNYYQHIEHDIPIDFDDFEEYLKAPYRWITSLNEVGFSSPQMCDNENAADDTCKTIFAKVDAGACNTNKHHICVVGVTSKHELVLRLQQ